MNAIAVYHYSPEVNFGGSSMAIKGCSTFFLLDLGGTFVIPHYRCPLHPLVLPTIIAILLDTMARLNLIRHYIFLLWDMLIKTLAHDPVV
jgi:hypothetical protein